MFLSLGTLEGLVDCIALVSVFGGFAFLAHTIDRATRR
jgi:hypothetical protein